MFRGSVLRAFLLVMLSMPWAVGCSSSPQSPEPHVSANPPTESPLATASPRPPTPALSPTPPGKIIVVGSPDDSGPGTLRQALLEAQPGDTITFDPTVFPPGAPVTVTLTSCLPPLSQGYVTVDASDAGVILNGASLGDNWCSGLTIISNWNTIRGLRFESFAPGAGIELSGGAQHNLIGGDPAIGTGPLGQSNLIAYGDLGMNISGVGIFYNTITGNFIGTDKDGVALSNNGSGIWISEGAALNTIGPDNIVAHNGVYGVKIVDADTVGNTITQNKIYDNARGGMGLAGIGSRPSGNAGLPIPFITNFDLVAGTVAGLACAGCNVELFSDAGDQGGTFEGRTSADSAGAYTFSRGAPFMGPHLTATATDAEANTSSFSDPTSGGSLHVVLQNGNDLSRTVVVPRSSVDLEDNHMGEQFSVHCESQSEDEAASHFGGVNNLGLKWVRLSVDWFDWPDIEKTGDYSTYEITACQRQAIDLLFENGISIYYTLLYWDPEITAYTGYTRFRTQDEIDRFVDYTRFIISNFRGQVTWYGILNEPNAEGDDQRHVLVDDYINLVRQVVPVIRELDL